jgi:hypothetical protein
MKKVLVIALALTLVITAAAIAGQGMNPLTKIGIHARAHGACKTLPTFPACSSIITAIPALNADIDVIPVLFDITQYTVAEFGMTWPAEWGTGSWSRCLGNIAIGTIHNPGEGTAISWSVCMYAWSVAPGFLWIFPSSAGIVTPIPNPATGDMGVVDCTPTGVGGPYYDHPMCIFSAGFPAGDDPCEETAVEQSTWGSIKGMFK